MRKKLPELSVILLAVLTVAQLSAQTEVGIMSINTEWFWDHVEPHEGQTAIGPRGNAPSERAVNLEAFAIAQMILAHQANIVGLVEVESENVVDLIVSYLPAGWTRVFVRGRDTFTGQDVALITSFDVISGTATNFGTLTGTDRPSKILGVGLNVGTSQLYVIVTHLISKRSSNDAKRLRQAQHIRPQAISVLGSGFDHAVILGDINDEPGSPPLNALLGLNDTSGNFIQTAITTGPDAAFSFVFDGRQQLIDHILLSPTLASVFDISNAEQRLRGIDLGPISDHRAVMVRFELN
jgi:hypothetical protein